MKPPLERFLAKVRFVPGLGCVEWTGGTSHANAGQKRMGVFKYEGKRWTARAWAAKFILGLPLEPGMVTEVRCGNPMCVRHLRTEYPAINLRQHWLLVAYGYGDDEPEDHRAERLARERQALEAMIPEDERGVPDWLVPFMETGDAS